MSEYAPPPPKVRLTRAQLRQVQDNYKNASKIAKDTKEIEENEKLADLAKLDDELKEIT